MKKISIFLKCKNCNHQRMIDERYDYHNIMYFQCEQCSTVLKTVDALRFISQKDNEIVTNVIQFFILLLIIGFYVWIVNI